MYICIDCNNQSEKANNWFVELNVGKNIYRCQDCGKKESDKRKEMRYENKTKPKFIE